MMNLLSSAWTVARTKGRAFFPAMEARGLRGKTGRAGPEVPRLTSVFDSFGVTMKPRSREAAKPRSRLPAPVA